MRSVIQVEKETQDRNDMELFKREYEKNEICYVETGKN